MILFVLIVWVGWELIKGLVYRKKGNEKTRPFRRFGSSDQHRQQTEAMGLFSRKKKEEPHYDPSNLKIKDLRVGFMLDYNLKTWEISEEYEYDWGDQYFTREFKLDAADDTAYLHIDFNDDQSMTLSRKVNVRALGQDIPEAIMEKQSPPSKISYEGVEYFLDRKSPGYFSDDPEDDNSWTELISWDYYDSEGKLVACVEQWGEQEFEASYGKVVNEFEITNILPATV
jgi:hypothetical protein